MSSIKCPQCGLVNFSTASHCKRCQADLNELAPIAEQRSYQAPTRHFQEYQMPPPPPIFHESQTRSLPRQGLHCVTCGGRQNISFQNFKKDYVPPIAYLGFFAGLLPLVILILVLRTRHKINVPFCAECWKNYRTAKILETFSSLGFLIGLIISIIAGVAAESLVVFFLFFGVTIALYIWGAIYTKKVSPKIKQIDRRQIVIDAPIVGELCFQK